MYEDIIYGAALCVRFGFPWMLMFLTVSICVWAVC